MAKLDFSGLLPLFDSDTNFSITETQYRKIVGRDLPKQSSYLINKSAVARVAAKYGYKICLEKRTITFEKCN